MHLPLFRDPLVSRGNPSGPPVDALRQDTLQYLLVRALVLYHVDGLCCCCVMSQHSCCIVDCCSIVSTVYFVVLLLYHVDGQHPVVLFWSVELRCLLSCLQDLKRQVVASGEDLMELEASVSRLREMVATQRAAETAAAEERQRRLEAAHVAGLVPPVNSEAAGPLVQPSEA